MLKNISQLCKDCYQRHIIDNTIIYTDQYGKTVIEEESFATVGYNHDDQMADIYCKACGDWIGNANCATDMFWSFVHDVVKKHQCAVKMQEKR